MEQYLNPWATEVIERHPEIHICDQWQFVKNNEDGLYADWWAGKNVHFNGKSADALGQFLADFVKSVMKGEKPDTESVETVGRTQPPTNIRN